MQIGLQQADDVELHVADEVAHAALAVPPRVVDPEVHGPDPRVEQPRAGMCRRGCRRRRGRMGGEGREEADEGHECEEDVGVRVGRAL